MAKRLRPQIVDWIAATHPPRWAEVNVPLDDAEQPEGRFEAYVRPHEASWHRHGLPVPGESVEDGAYCRSAGVGGVGARRCGLGQGRRGRREGSGIVGL